MSPLAYLDDVGLEKVSGLFADEDRVLDFHWIGQVLVLHDFELWGNLGLLASWRSALMTALSSPKTL